MKKGKEVVFPISKLERFVKTEPLQISSEVLTKLRIYVADKPVTLKETAEKAIMQYIK